MQHQHTADLTGQTDDLNAIIRLSWWNEAHVVPTGQVGGVLFLNSGLVPISVAGLSYNEPGQLVTVPGVLVTAGLRAPALPTSDPQDAGLLWAEAPARLAAVVRETSVVVSASTEAAANLLIALPALTYTGAPEVIAIRFYTPSYLIDSTATARFLVRRADTQAVLGTLGRLKGFNPSTGSPVMVETALSLMAGTYGLEIAAWVTNGAFLVEAGVGGPGDTLGPAYATITRVTPLTARVIRQSVG
jgi:hypothetical protein